METHKKDFIDYASNLLKSIPINKQILIKYSTIQGIKSQLLEDTNAYKLIFLAFNDDVYKIHKFCINSKNLFEYEELTN